MKSKLIMLAVLGTPAFSTSTSSADLEAENSSPPAQCLSLGEPGRNFGTLDIEQFPDFDAAISEITANCQANEHHYALAVEGMCADGRRLLNTGTGFTNSVRLYTSDGEFESQIFQTDVQSAPVWANSFGPATSSVSHP